MFYGLPELRAQLEAAGWRTERDSMASEMNLCDWYAWHPERADITPDCDCNDKPPGFIVHPHELRLPDGRSHSSVEVELIGEKLGRWWKLRAYSIQPEELMEALPRVRAGLAAAWAAIAASAAA